MAGRRASLDDFERPPPREIRRNPAVIGEIITSAYKIQRQKCPMLSGTRIMRFVARYGPPSLSPPRPKALVSYSRGWTKDEGKEGRRRSVRGGTMNRRLSSLFLAPLEGEKDSTVVRRRPLSPFPESSRVIAVADGIAATQMRFAIRTRRQI